MKKKKLSLICFCFVILSTLSLMIFLIVKITELEEYQVGFIVLLALGIILMLAFFICSMHFIVNHFFLSADIEIGELQKLVSGKKVTLNPIK